MGAVNVGTTFATSIQGNVVRESASGESQQQAYSIQTKGPRSFLSSQSLPPGAVTVTAGASKPVPRDPNVRNRRIDHLPALLIAYELQRADVSVEFLGNDEFEGRTVYKIALSRTSNTGTNIDAKLTANSRIELFIDGQTFFVVATERKLLSSTDTRRSMPLEIRYSDYRNINGLFIPFQQATYLDGHKLSEFVISSAAVDAGSATSGVN